MPGMYHRTSPIVLLTNAARSTVQLVVVGAATIAAFAVLDSYGYQLAPVAKFCNDLLLKVVIS
jgi:hypothetical protein